MTELPSFTVVAKPRLVDGTQTNDELAEVIPNGATVEFTSNLPKDALLAWDGRLEHVLPVAARISLTGDVVTAAGDPVRLLAAHPDLGVTGLQWTAVVTVPAGRYHTRTLTPIVFDAPTDGGTVNLAAVTPSVSPAPVVGVAFTAAALLDMLGDATSGVRTALDDLYSQTLIDGGTP